MPSVRRDVLQQMRSLLVLEMRQDLFPCLLPFAHLPLLHGPPIGSHEGLRQHAISILADLLFHNKDKVRRSCSMLALPRRHVGTLTHRSPDPPPSPLPMCAARSWT